MAEVEQVKSNEPGMRPSFRSANNLQQMACAPSSRVVEGRIPRCSKNDHTSRAFRRGSITKFSKHNGMRNVQSMVDLHAMHKLVIEEEEAEKHRFEQIGSDDSSIEEEEEGPVFVSNPLRRQVRSVVDFRSMDMTKLGETNRIQETDYFQPDVISLAPTVVLKKSVSKGGTEAWTPASSEAADDDCSGFLFVDEEAESSVSANRRRSSYSEKMSTSEKAVSSFSKKDKKKRSPFGWLLR